MLNELGDALFKLITQALSIPEGEKQELELACKAILNNYIQNLSKIGASRPGEFNRKVLRKYRREMEKAGLESIQDQIRARMSMKNFHLQRWINTFFDYGLIASRFLDAPVSELRQASGAPQKFFIVKMAQDERKQLMYELTSRIVDAETLPVNVIIVSLWARTGWNVVRPNILIDATATRNVTAWQQLRGRAMRAMTTWDKDCYGLVMQLLGSHVHKEDMGRISKPSEQLLDSNVRELLLEVYAQAPQDEKLKAKIKAGKLQNLTAEERNLLVARLMLSRNKVTHIYELVKAYGSNPQVRYDHKEESWLRKESIAVKHSHEYSVNPLDGQYGAGEKHAPLIYSKDPRENLPSQLLRILKSTLKNADPIIVNGWISTVASGVKEEIGLE